jgi:hypothetical protein
VIGIVGDVRQDSLVRAGRPEVYAPLLQAPVPYMALIVRTRTQPTALTAAVRQAVMAVDSWTVGAGIPSGPLLRSIKKAGKIWGHGFTPKVIWAIVKANAKSCGLPSVAPHDLRRTCARLCHQVRVELVEIKFLLGHVSIQTTERYLACKQRFHDAVNDHIGL